jgi:polyribonucleotide nucleotidyltransferase
MTKKITEKSLDFHGQTITLKTGRLAPKATAAVEASLGETSLLVTVMSGRPQENLDYFPLQVVFSEKLYAGGVIKGSKWVKREGRPSDETVLSARLIDRAIRPLFPQDYNGDVQIIVSVFSIGKENSADFLGLLATSAALAISSVPWNGPVAGIKVGQVDQKLLINPTIEQMEKSDLDLFVSTGSKGVNMIEAGASQVPDQKVLEAVLLAKSESQKLIKFIKDFASTTSVKKTEYLSSAPPQDLIDQIKKDYQSKIKKLLDSSSDEETGSNLVDLKDQIQATLSEKYSSRHIDQAFSQVVKKTVRQNILDGKRLDDRTPQEIRPLKMEIGLFGRTHGSALFQRGLTQVLTITTLGSLSLKLYSETAQGEETKRYMHHYSALPFSFGETGRIGSPGRREIGHGALAEKALLPVLPDEKDFPYTIHTVSEIMSQNGSSSMGSTCGSTISLLDAGVPLRAPVAGISTGLVAEGDKTVFLTDILGIEDFNGDMDFKITGTETGITAIQLDIKITGLKDEWLEKIFVQNKEARTEILKQMTAVISTPKPLSSYAPKIKTISIDPSKIGEIIGSGGRTIKALMERYQVDIDIEDDGLVSVIGTDPQKIQETLDHIDGMIREVHIGEEFEGTVKRVVDFGFFVEFLPGREGLLHISRLGQGFVSDPRTIMKEGDQIKVRIDDKDRQGKISLSKSGVPPSATRSPSPQRPRSSGPRRSRF